LATEPRRLLNWWDALAINISIIIGVGIFRVPAEVAANLHSADLILAAWTAAGFICLLGGLCYGELASSFPENGGNYLYLKESFGVGTGFLFGWTELLVIRTGSIAAIAYVFAEHVQSLIGSGQMSVKLIAFGVVFLLSILNIVGLNPSRRVQEVVTFLLISSIVIVVFFGLFSSQTEPSHFERSTAPFETSFFEAMGLSLIAILWTYGGWHESTFVTGETKNVRRSAPMILIGSVVLITAIYVLLNLVYIALVPVDEIAETPLIGVTVMSLLFGGVGERLFAVLIIVSSLGAINAMIITGSRVTRAMAEDNWLFGFLGRTEGENATPIRAIVLNGVWSGGLILWGNFHRLLYFTGIVVWLYFALVVVGLMVLRQRRPDLPRPFRVPVYPLVPVLFAVVCIGLMASTAVFSPRESIFGLGLMASGIPVYLLSRRLGRSGFESR
jgi:amino acid transporter